MQHLRVICHEAAQGVRVCAQRLRLEGCFYTRAQGARQAALQVALGNCLKIYIEQGLQPCQRGCIIAPLAAQPPVSCQVLQRRLLHASTSCGLPLVAAHLVECTEADHGSYLIHKNGPGQPVLAEEFKVGPDDSSPHGGAHYCHLL